MTVVNPKSISGITSITTASGSDNLLTIHTSDANNTERLRIDSTGATKIVTGIVTTLTATGSAKVGTGITLSPDGHSFVAGVSTTGTLSVSGIVTSTGDVDPSTGTVTTSGNITVGGDLLLESVTPAIKLTDSNQETDNKTFMISGSSTQKLRIQALTDAGGGGGQLFEFVRDGSNVYQFQGAKSAIPWFVVNNNTKKVGIGSTIPTTALDVNGVITGDGSGLTAVNTPSFAARVTTTQSLAYETEATIIFDTEDHDTDGAYNTSTGEFTVPSGKGGVYHVSANFGIDDPGEVGDIVRLRVFKNGSLLPGFRGQVQQAKINIILTTSVSGSLTLAAGDVIKCMAYTSSNVGDAHIEVDTTYFSMFRLSI